MLFARHVYDMRLTADKDGFQTLTWEEGIFPEITSDTRRNELAKHFNRKKRRPRKRRLMTFSAKTRAIVMGAEIYDPES